MSAKDIFAAAAMAMFNALGQDAVFTPAVGDPVSCKVDIEKDVDLQPIGYEAAVWAKETLLECLLAVIGKEPDRGETFQVGSTIYKVKSIVKNDGTFVTAAVNEN